MADMKPGSGFLARAAAIFAIRLVEAVAGLETRRGTRMSLFESHGIVPQKMPGRQAQVPMLIEFKSRAKLFKRAGVAVRKPPEPIGIFEDATWMTIAMLLDA